MPDSAPPPSRHAAIADTLRAQIRSEELTAGTPVASESELAARFGVSRGTVRQALAALRAEGLIAGGRGRRPVVARPALSQSFDQTVSFTAWAQELGRTPSARTLELARRPADPEIARRLGLEPGTQVFQYKRLRLLDGQPAMIEHATFIEPVGRLLLDCDLDTGSVYLQLSERGVRFAEASQSIAAVAANVEQASLLAVARRAPLLAVTRRVFDPNGVALELSLDMYRADEFTITVHNRVALPRAGVGLRVLSR
jgi:GntR family transcriptional regulator